MCVSAEMYSVYKYTLSSDLKMNFEVNIITFNKAKALNLDN